MREAFGATWNGHVRLGKTALAILSRIMDTPGHPPTVRELCEAAGDVRLHAVHGQLKRLVRLGLLSWEPAKARTLLATCRFIPENEL